MSEPFKTEAEKYEYKGVGDQTEKKVLCVTERIKTEVRNNLLAVLLASAAISLLTGYFLSRRREARRRTEWAETIFRQVKEWANKGGRKASGPMSAGLDYALAAAQEASSKGAEYGRRLNPFKREFQRRFLGMF
jgi:hypothetical protein